MDQTVSVRDAGPAQRPSIAAIIPLYNGAAYIRQSLESVLAQTFAPDEIIVVDDGSTDGGKGAAIVAAYIEDHPEVELLRKINGGQSSARNLGVAHSSADLIAFLDQDDAWYPHHLEVLVKPFQRQRPGIPLGWAYSNLDEIDLDGSLVCRNFLSTLGTSHPKRNIVDCLNQDMFVLPSASLIDRRAFDAVGGFDERLIGYEDDDLFLRLFRAGYENIYIDRPLSKWRIHGASSSYSPSMSRSRAIYAAKLLDMYPDAPERHRYYPRHLIAPRFLPAMGMDCLRKLRRLDGRAAWEALKRIAIIWPHLRWRWWIAYLPIATVLAAAHARLPKLFYGWRDTRSVAGQLAGHGRHDNRLPLALGRE